MDKLVRDKIYNVLLRDMSFTEMGAVKLTFYVRSKLCLYPYFALLFSDLGVTFYKNPARNSVRPL